MDWPFWWLRIAFRFVLIVFTKGLFEERFFFQDGLSTIESKDLWRQDVSIRVHFLTHGYSSHEPKAFQKVFGSMLWQ